MAGMLILIFTDSRICWNKPIFGDSAKCHCYCRNFQNPKMKALIMPVSWWLLKNFVVKSQKFVAEQLNNFLTLFNWGGHVPILYYVCSIHRGDTMSTSGGYHKYIRGVMYIGNIFKTGNLEISLLLCILRLMKPSDFATKVKRINNQSDWI